LWATRGVVYEGTEAHLAWPVAKSFGSSWRGEIGPKNATLSIILVS